MNEPHLLLRPDLVADSDALFDRLTREIVWDERMRARKTASFGAPYNYSQITYPSAPMPPRIAELLPMLEREIGFEPNNCLVNFYADGASAMGFHFDALEPLEWGTGVAIVSLGNARTLMFRRRDDKTIEHAFVLNSGSLLYMAPEIQNEWLHGVPKQPEARGRLSLTFRRLKPLQD